MGHLSKKTSDNDALYHKATAIILVHNHPGGSAKPSGADKLITAEIMRVARDLVDVMEHRGIEVEWNPVDPTARPTTGPANLYAPHAEEP